MGWPGSEGGQGLAFLEVGWRGSEVVAVTGEKLWSHQVGSLEGYPCLMGGEGEWLKHAHVKYLKMHVVQRAVTLYMSHGW